jgi:replicative DNA helicase
VASIHSIPRHPPLATVRMPAMESRLPPQNLEAEQSVLGSILLDNEVYSAIEGMLTAEQFYKESHRKIYRIFEKLARRGEPIDLVTVTEELRQSNELESIGSVPYLIGLADSVPTAAYAENYAKIVAEKAVLRDLIGASGQIMQTAYDQAMPLEQILDKAESSIFELATNKRSHSFQGMGGLMTETFAQINELFNNPDPITGLRMGFKELDNITAGLQPSSLNVLAARPSMGKTAMALTIGQNAALRDGKTIGVFSLEMSAVQLVTRMLCSEARVDMSRVRNGQLSERDFQRLADTAGRMSEAKVFIDDNAEMTVMELRSRARRLMAEHGLGLVIIDYLQLMSGSNKSAGGGENRQQEISVISRGLKALARELDVPVLVLSQLSRAVESRPNKRPMLSDLRECVTGDTLVALRDGRRVPIKDLVGTTPCVYAITLEGKLTCAKSDKVWHVGKKEVFEVLLESGRVIKATAKHQLLSARGWQRVADLRVGDALGVSRLIPEPCDPVVWPEHEVILLGHLIGDGSYLKHQPLRYTTISEENSKAVEDAAKALGSTVTRHAGRGNWHQLVIAGNGNRWHAKGVGKWLKELGIFNQRSHEKRIPESAFRLGNEQVALLLRHLWATDGCIHVRKGIGSHSIYYATNSRGLAEDVAALLLRFGIVARLKKFQKGKYSPSRQVWVSGLENQQTFLNVIGAFGPRKNHAEQLLKALDGKKANTNVDIVPNAVFNRVRELMKAKGISMRDMATLRGTTYGGLSHFRFSPSRRLLKEYAEILGDEILCKLATNDLFWDKIKSITPAGEEDVYDLTVPGPSSWLADSIVSHNSGAIEQDADLVMFIYRDEYYDQQSEKQGIAEVIIGKQRNGPVGTVELQFHSAHVRFNDLAKPT